MNKIEHFYSSAKIVQRTDSVGADLPPPKLQLPGASIATVAVISTTSLNCKIQGSLDGSLNWYDLSPDLVLAAGELFRADCSGFVCVRVLTNSGTGQVDFTLCVEGAADGEESLVPAGSLQADINTTVAGDAVTRTFAAVTSGAKGQWVHNNSETYAIWFKGVAVGAAASTITSTNKEGIIGPGETVRYPLNPGETLDLKNNTGASTTVTFNAGEF